MFEHAHIGDGHVHITDTGESTGVQGTPGEIAAPKQFHLHQRSH